MESISRFIVRSFYVSSMNAKTIPKNLKGKTKSSQEWLTRHLSDPYVHKAQKLNLRARSAFKLAEIDDKVKILKPGLTVVECGAAPGAWTQIILQRINSEKTKGSVIGIDLLPIEPLDGAIFLSPCDFTDPKIQNEIFSLIDTKGIDIVFSDMAPNASGIKETDHYKIIKLATAALEFAVRYGKVGGHFLTKIWDGSEAKNFEKKISNFYKQVSRHKPPCSRNDSSEIFILGRFKLDGRPLT